MKPITHRTILGVITLAALTAWMTVTYGTMQAQSGASGRAQLRDQMRRLRFTREGAVDGETLAARTGDRAVEALVGFDNQTNGFSPQGPNYDALDEDTVVPLRSFNDNRFIFEEVETTHDGLGPTYNAQSCRECHQNVVTGGASQVTEHRTGHLQDGQFFESQGGSLVQSRATHPDAGEVVTVEDDIRTFRISTNTLGAGYVEAIANTTLTQIRANQPAAMRGALVLVPVLEASGKSRIGRFGWKDQHASLESFAADAYLNEMGITSPLFPEENSAGGRDIQAYDPVPDPEDDGVDIVAFANFMRATKAPSRGPISTDARSGEQVFTRLGCATCHVASITTAPPDTPINGGALRVHRSLGNRVIHPYSDFLMHDIGTGDGIPVQTTPEYAFTTNQIRTAPLWGLRTRNRLMHDGLSFTREEAIMRHAGQATAVTTLYKSLVAADKARLMAFLNSL